MNKHPLPLSELLRPQTLSGFCLPEDFEELLQ